MKKAEWFLAFLIMAMGIGCLTVSATSYLEHPSDSYIRTVLTLCLWLGIPLFLMGAVYWIGSQRRRR